ncbi:MAG TPA: alpha/beta hydrolase [Deltaproteobacteria bacterium]|nr:alpha/beta hydrolase [Deltaproteobacteria bacterium]
MPRPPLRALAVLSIVLVLGGCAGTWESIGAGLAYRKVALPDEQVRLDLPYRNDDDADAEKHRLDLFLPDPAIRDWPTVVFVHGGGWTSGDRATKVLGIEPARNIGRFFAAHGVGAAVISYRLQPGVSWREQVEDVADATAWVHREVGRWGGDANALFLSGHSAGAWLAAWVGLADSPLARLGLDRSGLCGLVLVSGAGYDLEDEQTYALGAKRSYFENLFADDDPEWARSASIRKHVDEPVPPVLILSAEGEPGKFRRQGDLLFRAIEDRSPMAQRFVVPGQDHQRIVVSMSRAGDPVSRSILDFLEWAPCSSAVE